ncbi:MAG: hypothetical protein GX456_14220 [Verrucomicrobia bacterium]|nr:hypothetical protein [Verrucomicrobiota bacterium]
MTTKATEALQEAIAIYRAGSPEWSVRGLLMQLVAECAASGQWECALSLASSCADAETRNEAVRLVILKMAERDLWLEAVRHVHEHFPPGHPARARVVVTLASVALRAGKPDSEQAAIVARLADQLQGYLGRQRKAMGSDMNGA